MPIFMNPLMKHDVSDFPDVYVPLEQLERQSSAVAANDEKVGANAEQPPFDKEVEAGTKSGSLYTTTTMESLREEIGSGMTLHRWDQSKTWRLIH